MDQRRKLEETGREWRPPTELRNSPPREVVLTIAGKIIVATSIAIALAGVIIGTAVYAGLSQEQKTRDLLARSGIATDAVTAGSWISSGNDRHYWTEYRYQANGRTYSGRIQSDHETWLHLQKSRIVRVRYLPEAPERHIAVSFQPGTPPPWIALGIAPAALAQALVLFWLVARQRRLLAEGAPAPAMVTRLARSDHGKKIAHYVFLESSRILIKGKSGPQKNPPPVDSIITVLYQPDRAKRNSPYPVPLVKLRQD